MSCLLTTRSKVYFKHRRVIHRNSFWSRQQKDVCTDSDTHDIKCSWTAVFFFNWRQVYILHCMLPNTKKARCKKSAFLFLFFSFFFLTQLKKRRIRTRRTSRRRRRRRRRSIFAHKADGSARKYINNTPINSKRTFWSFENARHTHTRKHARARSYKSLRICSGIMESSGCHQQTQRGGLSVYAWRGLQNLTV